MRETTIGKRLLPLVQLVPAAAVAAIVLVTLPHTIPVLAAVPERLQMIQQEPDSESTVVEEESEDLTGLLPYADGVYTGSSRGYGGTVQVQVTMEGGRITDLQILNASHETKSFLRRSKRLLSIVLDAQTWEVDAVSEATYTSRGILGAIRNALTGEVVNNPLPPQPKPAEPLEEEEFITPSAYRDGVYTATAEGFGGPITVQVTVANDKIEDITIISHDGETTSYFSKARRVVSEILETGSPEGVDAVSGATYSSTGLLNAVKLALSKAANDTGTLEEPAEQPADSTPEEPGVMQPTVEVVQVEDDTPSLRRWAQQVWDKLFPEQSAASESTAESEAASVPESEPTQPDSTAADSVPEELPEGDSAAASEGTEEAAAEQQEVQE